ncbi:MAG: hypothetical protein IJE43_03630 [Alphaproteobacteria bacterium]|nr:hypothetical protein [Alphaproteobacteria bacterium]
MDSTVLHEKFGKGTLVKINKNEKFIHVKFTLGEKKFIFPDAFLMGFLEGGGVIFKHIIKEANYFFMKKK